MRVAAFTKYDREAASTRQRLLQYIPALRDAGIEVEFHPLLGDDYVRSLVTGQPFSRAAVLQSYVRRFRQLLTGPECDLVWIYGELFPYLPGLFEKLAFRSARPIVYDIDDAFFLTYQDTPLLSGKIEPLLRGATAICCGNEHLRDYAAGFSGKALLVPTVVDIDRYVPRPADADRQLTIGWIGTPSTWGYVRPALPVLQELCASNAAKVLVVGAGEEARRECFPGLELRDWCEAREIADIQDMDIGIMPLPDEPWARGKSGYKLVQYMACGLPVVASPVGVNSTIVEHGANGLLASGQSEWRSALESLLAHAGLRARMGSAGREKIVTGYSLQAQAPRLIDILRSAVRTG